MWIVTEYKATTLFSLKPATATASGGKTLLVPTPFAIKMALLDAACRLDGVGAAASAWAWLRGLVVALHPPSDVVVNNTFIKVRKQWEFKGKAPDKPEAVEKAKEARKYPFQDTISYREYAQLVDAFGIALELTDGADSDALMRWLMNINYLGKRGGFIQMVAVPSLQDTLPLEYLILDGHLEDEIDLNSVLTQLDDVNPQTSFEQVDIYSGKRLTLGKDRLLYKVTLPYEQAASSRGYTHYRRID